MARNRPLELVSFIVIISITLFIFFRFFNGAKILGDAAGFVSGFFGGGGAPPAGQDTLVDTDSEVLPQTLPSTKPEVITEQFASMQTSLLPQTSLTIRELETLAAASVGKTGAGDVFQRFVAEEQLKNLKGFRSQQEIAKAQFIDFADTTNRIAAVGKTIILGETIGVSSRGGLINLSQLRAKGLLPTTLTAQQVLGLAGRTNF